MIRLFTLFLITNFITLASGQAQKINRNHHYTSVGVSLMASNYYGDITPGPSVFSTDLRLTNPKTGIFINRKLSRQLSANIGFNWARLQGSDSISTRRSQTQDAGRWQRNLSFRNDIKELSVLLVLDLAWNDKIYKSRPLLTPYIFGGAALFYNNPKAYYKGPALRPGWYELQPLQTEGVTYARQQIALPFGLGLRCRLNRHFDLGFEIGWRATFTDYLDDVSGVYANKSDLYQKHGTAAVALSDRSGELTDLQHQQISMRGADEQLYIVTAGFSEPGMQRGDSHYNDWYLLSGFTLSYILPPFNKGAKFR